MGNINSNNSLLKDKDLNRVMTNKEKIKIPENELKKKILYSQIASTK